MNLGNNKVRRIRLNKANLELGLSKRTPFSSRTTESRFYGHHRLRQRNGSRINKCATSYCISKLARVRTIKSIVDGARPSRNSDLKATSNLSAILVITRRLGVRPISSITKILIVRPQKITPTRRTRSSPVPPKFSVHRLVRTFIKQRRKLRNRGIDHFSNPRIIW